MPSSGLRLIHISDTHFTDSPITWELHDGFPWLCDHQTSPEKAARLAAFLGSNHERLGASAVVITGDLTDSGSIGDYEIARAFVSLLRNDGVVPIPAVREGVDTYVVPGNHDYNFEGLIFTGPLLLALKALSPPIPPPVDDPGAAPSPPGFDASPGEWADFIARAFEWGHRDLARKTYLAAVATFVAGATPIVSAQLAMLGVVVPPAFVSFILDRYIKNGGDVATSDERRRRFHDSLAQGQSYPRAIEIRSEDGVLSVVILLDSMQGQVDHPCTDLLAQGRLGSAQLDALERMLTTYEGSARRGGGKIVVCLHHSPLETADEGDKWGIVLHGDKGGLHDAREFLELISGRVDGVLFGHTTPTGTRQQPRPSEFQADNGDALALVDRIRSCERVYKVGVVNCVNLEHVDSEFGPSPLCPVTVIDFDSGTRTTYDAYDPDAAPEVTGAEAASTCLAGPLLLVLPAAS
jgi:3',5'-cyclic AMP phosphodiesterase CpdA